MLQLKEDSLAKISKWVHDSANLDHKYHKRLRDELTLIKVYKGHLHKHDLRDSYKDYLNDLMGVQEIPDIVKRMFGMEQTLEAKMEQLPKEEEDYQRWKEALRKISDMDGRVLTNRIWIDFDNDRFYCDNDILYIGLINDSIEHCEMLMKNL